MHFLLNFYQKLIDGSCQVKGASISDVFLASDVAFHDRRIPIPVSVPCVFQIFFLATVNEAKEPNFLYSDGQNLNLKAINKTYCSFYSYHPMIKINYLSH
jgi:hypothetical protein